MTKLSPCSSRGIIGVLERDGFYAKRKSSGGSHQTFCKDLADGKILIVVVPLGKREIPVGTISSILRQANMLHERFLELLK